MVLRVTIWFTRNRPGQNSKLLTLLIVLLKHLNNLENYFCIKCVICVQFPTYIDMFRAFLLLQSGNSKKRKEQPI